MHVSATPLKKRPAHFQSLLGGGGGGVLGSLELEHWGLIESSCMLWAVHCSSLEVVVRVPRQITANIVGHLGELCMRPGKACMTVLCSRVQVCTCRAGTGE